LGFGKAFNLMMNYAAKQGAEYFLALNPDMILEPDSIEKLVCAMDEDGDLGSAGPLILKWDFQNNVKTDIIDTCGINLLTGLRFVDAKQGLKNIDFETVEIIGPSGAAAIYRIKSLEAVKANNKYFDEMMFMYKEDCDLAYRLFLAGYKSKCVSDSLIYHDRTVCGAGEGNINIIKARKSKSKSAKKWSFANQQIIYYKYWKLQNWQNKAMIIWSQIKTFSYLLLFEPFLILEYYKFLKIRKKIIRY
jgi:GT2 family glycosyltransferase